MPTKRKNLSVIDLFAGCGGLSLGLEMAGFKPVFVNELNEHALRTYIENRRAVNPHLAEPGFHCRDIKDMVVNPRFIRNLNGRLKSTFGLQKGDVDLLVGGPPCQGFSNIGHRRSYAVDKDQLPSNHLFQDMAYVIHRIQPRAFMFENVRGILNAKWTGWGAKGEIFEEVVAAFAAIKGYRLAWHLLYAKDYGVPQNRPRVLLVGIRADVKVPNEVEGTADAVERGFLPGPTGKPAPSIGELFGDLEDPNYVNGGATLTYPGAASSEVQKMLRTSHDGTRVSAVGDPVTEHEYSRHRPRTIAKFAAMIAAPNHAVPARFRTKKFGLRVLPREWGAAGPTITATSLADDYVHYTQPRSLTVREWARLQMFPDWYQFAGKRTTGGLRRAGNPRARIFDREAPKYTQIGNAVPVQLAFEIGRHIAGILRRSRPA